MRKMKKIAERRNGMRLALALGLVAFALLAVSVRDAHADDHYGKETYPELVGRKLGRGASNTALGWLELPDGIHDVGEQHGVGAAATWGVLHGAGRAVQRTAVGIFEVLTFPFGLPRDFEPLMEPEFVLDGNATHHNTD